MTASGGNVFRCDDFGVFQSVFEATDVGKICAVALITDQFDQISEAFPVRFGDVNRRLLNHDDRLLKFVQAFFNYFHFLSRVSHRLRFDLSFADEFDRTGSFAQYFSRLTIETSPPGVLAPVASDEDTIGVPTEYGSGERERRIAFRLCINTSRNIFYLPTTAARLSFP